MRRVGVSADVVKVLKTWQKQQHDELTGLGLRPTDSGIIFTNEAGDYINPHSLDKRRKKLMSQAGVPIVRLHDLRHWHASILIAKGIDAKTVAERLGHARASFTVDTYTHLLDEHGERAVFNVFDL